MLDRSEREERKERAMMSSGFGDAADEILGKASASARRRRLALHRLNVSTEPQTKTSSSDDSVQVGGREAQPSDASGGSGIGGARMEPSGKSNPEASSSSRTPFRRLDGDINREAGMPLTGDEIVGKGNKARGVNCSAHGSISVVGRRREMEDRLTVAPIDFPASLDFFAVYDGHGGARVSSSCMDQLHRFIGERIQGCRVGEDVDWERVMKECFMKMDDEVNAEDSGGEEPGLGLGLGLGAELSRPPIVSRVRTDGSTALVTVLTEEEIVVANCGHSRAVLFRNGMVTPLSWDQKPDRPDERRRVEAAGGMVIDVNGLRVLGVLKATRSIGDHDLKSYMISEPEVTVSNFSELDSFIIIATDGLWDAVTSEDACEIVKKCLDGETRRRLRGESTKNPAVAAAMLAELAMAKGSKDNISVIVVELGNKNPTS